MKIISEFKDYYDTIQAFGNDDTVIYNRKFQYVRTERRFWNLDKNIISALDEMPYGRNMNYYPGVLLFCGKMYAVWSHTENDDHGLFEITGSTLPDIDDRFKIKPSTDWGYHDSVELNRMYFEDVPRKRSWYEDKFYRSAIQPFSDKLCGTKIDPEIHHRYNSPIIYIRASQRPKDVFNPIHVYLNPCLKQLGFQLVMDTWTTFQELEMYVGGILGKKDEAPLRVGNDEVIARSKGFDEQSFRTIAPGTKKLNRQENRKRKRGLV